MSTIHLNVLGTVLAEHGGQPVEFRTRKALALLVYLAVEGGWHSREKLTALFWPESSPENALAALRNTLLRLRAALGWEHNTGAADQPPHVQTAGSALRLSDESEGLQLDLAQLQAARRSLDEANPQVDLLWSAVRLYRGDFLEGFSLPDAPLFDEWAAIQRELCYQSFSQVLERLSLLESEGGALSRAVEAATRWVTHDPLDEAAYRCLMQLHFTLGNRQAALLVYASCQEALRRELGLDPSVETKALAERIRREPPPPSPEPIQRKIVPSPLPALESQLVGRQAEHSALVEAFYSVRRGAAQVATLEGEAGIGKSRLATAFLAWAAGQGADLLVGQAFELSGRLPYQSVVDALRQRLLADSPPDALPQEEASLRTHPVTGRPQLKEIASLLPDYHLAELSRLLPELRRWLPTLPPPATGDEADGRLRLFEAFTQLGEALAGRMPLILLIDDLQWADSGTLDLLTYALHRWRQLRARVFVITCLRSEELEPSPASPSPASDLAAWLAALLRERCLTRIALHPLSRENLQEWLKALEAGAPTSPGAAQFARWLHDETGGQPFYMVETLHALIESGLLPIQPAVGGGWSFNYAALPPQADLAGFLPPALRDFIHLRLHTHTPAAQALLAAGAVLGQRFDFASLTFVCGLEEVEALRLLDECLSSRTLLTASAEQHQPGSRAGIAPPPDQSGATYHFAHDQIRAVAYAEAGDARRKVFHRRAFEHLQAAGAPPGELARHALAAGMPGEAFQWSLAAGDDALHLFALREAASFYEQAWLLLSEQILEKPFQEERAKAAPEVIQRLFLQWGRAWELGDQLERANQVYQEMLTFSRQSGLARLESAALNHLATLAAQDGRDLQLAASLWQQAHKSAEASHDLPALAETEWNLGQLHYYAWQPTEARQHAGSALELARQLGLTSLEARCLNLLSQVVPLLGRWEDSYSYARESRRLFSSLGDQAMQAESQSIEGYALANLGRLDEGLASVREAYELTCQISNPWGQVYTGFNLVNVLVDVGDFEPALALAHHCQELAGSLHFPVLLLLSQLGLAITCLHLLDLDGARQAIGVMQGTNVHLGIEAYEEAAASGLCAAAGLEGDWSQALHFARLALQAHHPGQYFPGSTLAFLTEALVYAGELSLADEVVAEFSQHFDLNPRYTILYDRLQAALELGRGNGPAAARHLQAAADLAQELGLPAEATISYIRLGECLQATGSSSASAAAFRRALEINENLAKKIVDPTLRERFLAAPLIQRVNRDAQETALSAAGKSPPP